MVRLVCKTVSTEQIVQDKTARPKQNNTGQIFITLNNFFCFIRFLGDEMLF